VAGYAAAMFTMFRRAVFGAVIAALTTAILRIFGGDGAPPQKGGWREISPDELIARSDVATSDPDRQ